MARHRRRAQIVLVLSFICALGGCGQSTTSNAYGGPLNHVHSLLVLRDMPHIVLLASHVGLYRTADGGKTWKEVAGGNSQPMAGLMTYQLIQSPIDPQRLYVLGIPQAQRHATAGLYTSADAGQTWRIAAPFSHFPSDSIADIGAGTTSAGQVFAIVPVGSANALWVSNDSGVNWHALPAPPTGSPTGVAGYPRQPHRVMLWSSDKGLFISDDDGMTWHSAQGLDSGVYSVGVVGARMYIVGDAGVSTSSDNGEHFTNINPTEQFDVVAASDAAPDHAFALTTTAVFDSTDSGQSWRQTAPLPREPAALASDPTNPNIAYVGLSFPLGVEETTNGGSSWHAIFP